MMNDDQSYNLSFCGQSKYSTNIESEKKTLGWNLLALESVSCCPFPSTSQCVVLEVYQSQ